MPTVLEGVEVADDLGDRGHVLADEADRLLAQRPHALLRRQPLELLLGRPPHDEALHLRRYLEQLEDPDPVLVTGVGAKVAALAVPELALGRPARLFVERELLAGGRVGLLA